MYACISLMFQDIRLIFQWSTISLQGTLWSSPTNLQHLGRLSMTFPVPRKVISTKLVAFSSFRIYTIVDAHFFTKSWQIGKSPSRRSAVSPKEMSNGMTQEKPKIKQSAIGPWHWVIPCKEKQYTVKPRNHWAASWKAICHEPDITGSAYQKPKVELSYQIQTKISSLASGAHYFVLKSIEHTWGQRIWSKSSESNPEKSHYSSSPWGGRLIRPDTNDRC